MAGGVEGIRRALVLCLAIIAGTAIDQAPSVGPHIISAILTHQPVNIGIYEWLSV